MGGISARGARGPCPLVATAPSSISQFGESGWGRLDRLLFRVAAATLKGVQRAAAIQVEGE